MIASVVIKEVYLAVNPSIFLSSIFLSIHISINLSIYLSISLFLYLSIYLNSDSKIDYVVGESTANCAAMKSISAQAGCLKPIRSFGGQSRGGGCKFLPIRKNQPFKNREKIQHVRE